MHFRDRSTLTGRCLAAVAASLMAGIVAAHASLVEVASPTTGWTGIRYGGGNSSSDPSTDQQTGSAEGDIVGNSLNPSVYTMFGDANTPSLTDGHLAFRIRLGADSTPAGFKASLFVGIITNSSAGKIDLFLGVNNSGNADAIGIWSAGNGLNVSPSTTTIVSPALVSYGLNSANYSWMAVNGTNDPTATSFDLDGGTSGVDHFLSFSIPFGDIIAQLAAKGITGIDQNSTFSYVIATSQQGNALNQDLNGVGPNYTTSSTWATLGVLSDPTQPVAAVPEVNPAFAVVLLLIAAVAHQGWKQRRARVVS